MIEYFVHLDRDDPPPDLVVAAADVPDDVSRTRINQGSLPDTWRQTAAPVELAVIGDRVARRRREAILIVPSALVPDEANWLLNPDVVPSFDRRTTSMGVEAVSHARQP